MEVSDLESVVGALNRAGAIYVVVGGLAVIAHGYLRTTADLDVVVALDEPNCRAALAALATLGYVPRAPVVAAALADAEQRRRWVQEKGMTVFQMVSDRFPFCPVDIFVQEPFDVRVEAAQAARFEIAPGLWIPVLRYERLVELKRAAGRPTDLDDLTQLARLRALESS